MAPTGYPLEAYLLMDNNAVVRICEFYCDAYKRKPFPEMINTACAEVAAVFNKLSRFSLSKTILTTKPVRAEFKPERSVIANYPGFSTKHCDCLKDHVYKEIEAVDVNLGKIPALRAMHQTPSKYGEGLKRLSNQDLSLVILALGLAAQFHQRVYILMDEEDLRSFVSWMKTRPETKALCAFPEQIEALPSFICIDSAHRSCHFSTEQVYEFFSFLSTKQLERKNLEGTTKGKMISQTYKVLFEAIRESSAIKRQNARGGVTA